MPIQYTKDKTKRLSFRVNDVLYDWVSNRANALGVSPCDFSRSVLFQNMSAEEMLRAIDTPKKPTVAEIARSSRENKQKHK